MKMTIMSLAAVLAMGAAVANAQTMIEDADGNGTYSMDEMKVAYPDLTEEQFTAIDTSGDGEVDMDELAAAREAGTIAG